MKPRILFRPEARLELLDAEAWYEGSVAGLGEDFARIVDAALSAISDRPAAFPIIYKNVRQAVLRRFPYTVLFQVEEDDIVVLACHHQRRDPRRWRARAGDA